MAHQIATRADGEKAVFINGPPAWHKWGKPLQDLTSLDEASAAAGQNFEVDIRPSYTRVELPDGDEYFKAVPGANFTVRTDTNQVLGSVGDAYTVAQNADTARILEPLLDAGLAVLESGGTLRDGRDVWLQVRFLLDNPEVAEFQAKHGLLPYGLWSNNHAGERMQTLQTTRVRTVCANTLKAALSYANGRPGADENIRIRHTSGIKAATIAAAKELWGKIGANECKAMAQYRLMQQTMLTDAEFTALVLDVALPLPEKTPDTPRGKTMLAQRQQAREVVTGLWTGGLGHDGEPTMYNAYNGLVQAVDHMPTVFKVQGGDAARLGQLLHGNLGAIKTKVAEALIRKAVRT